jgi:hypothetical protein
MVIDAAPRESSGVPRWKRATLAERVRRNPDATIAPLKSAEVRLKPDATIALLKSG